VDGNAAMQRLSAGVRAAVLAAVLQTNNRASERRGGGCERERERARELAGAATSSSRWAPSLRTSVGLGGWMDGWKDGRWIVDGGGDGWMDGRWIVDGDGDGWMSACVRVGGCEAHSRHSQRFHVIIAGSLILSNLLNVCRA
jgi:hypothetical protein